MRYGNRSKDSLRVSQSHSVLWPVKCCCTAGLREGTKNFLHTLYNIFKLINILTGPWHFYFCNTKQLWMWWLLQSPLQRWETVYIPVNMLKFLYATGVLSWHGTKYLLRGIAVKISKLYYRMVCQRCRTELKLVLFPPFNCLPSFIIEL